MIRKYVISGALLIIIFLSSPYVSAQSVDSTRVRLRYHPDIYHEKGRSAADADYTAIGPFVTGFMTGMIAPFTAGYSIHLGNKKGEMGGAFAGVAGFTGTIWGGKKVANLFSIPAPDHNRTEYSQDQQASFVEGYVKRVDEKRTVTYATGVFLGLLADLAFVLWIASQIGPIGA